MNKYKVVGIVKGVSKKGSQFTILHLLGSFDSYNISKGAKGQSVSNVYVSKDLDVNLNDVIQLVYGVGYQGKAIVVDIIK